MCTVGLGFVFVLKIREKIMMMLYCLPFLLLAFGTGHGPLGGGGFFGTAEA